MNYSRNGYMEKILAEAILFRKNRVAEKTAMDFAPATGYVSYSFGMPGLPSYHGPLSGLPLCLSGCFLPSLPPAMYQEVALGDDKYKHKLLKTVSEWIHLRTL